MAFRFAVAVILAVGLVTPGPTQEKKTGNNYEKLKKQFTDEQLGHLIEQLQDLDQSRRKQIQMMIDAPKEVEVRASEKKPEVSIGEIKFEVKVKNISKEIMKFRPLYIGLALCEENGVEFPVGHWRYNAPHGVTGAYDTQPGTTQSRGGILTFAHEQLKPGQTYVLVASYFSMTEQVYAIHSFKTVAKKAKQ